MALRNNQDIIFHVFIDNVPRLFAALFGPADTRVPLRWPRVWYIRPVLADLFTVDGEDFTRLRR